MDEFAHLGKIWYISLTSTTRQSQSAMMLTGLENVLAEELTLCSLLVASLFVCERRK
jgi:hypothetical protein